MMYVAPEHEFEAVHGLPAALPAGENIIWQGSPVVSSFARNAFHIRALTGYFALLLVLLHKPRSINILVLAVLILITTRPLEVHSLDTLL